MESRSSSVAGASGREVAIQVGLALLGGATLLVSVPMIVDPAGFIAQVGGFGAENDHLVRDIATWTTVYGVALLVAIRQPSWRVPVLAIGVAQGALHVVNHVADAGLAVPDWKGAANSVVFGLIVLFTLALLIASHRERAH